MYHKLDLAAAKINIEYTLKDGKNVYSAEEMNA